MSLILKALKRAQEESNPAKGPLHPPLHPLLTGFEEPGSSTKWFIVLVVVVLVALVALSMMFFEPLPNQTQVLATPLPVPTGNQNTSSMPDSVSAGQPASARSLSEEEESRAGALMPLELQESQAGKPVLLEQQPITGGDAGVPKSIMGGTPALPFTGEDADASKPPEPSPEIDIRQNQTSSRLLNPARTLGRALEAEQAGDWSTALVLYRQVLEAEPGNPAANLNAGALLQRLGDLNAAVARYAAVPLGSPQRVKALNNLGVLQMGRGHHPEAEAAFREALSLDRSQAGLYNNLGIALKRQKRLEEAVDQYTRALELQPGYAEAVLNLAVALDEGGAPGKAAGFYQQFLRLAGASHGKQVKDVQARLVQLSGILKEQGK